MGSPVTKCTSVSSIQVPCEQWFIRITDEAASNQTLATRPQVFFSGNLHGDEQVHVCTRAACGAVERLWVGAPRPVYVCVCVYVCVYL